MNQLIMENAPLSISNQLIAFFNYPEGNIPRDILEKRRLFAETTEAVSIRNILFCLYEDSDILVYMESTISTLPVAPLRPRLPPSTKDIIHFGLPPNPYVMYGAGSPHVLSFFHHHRPLITPTFAIGSWTVVAPLGLVFCRRIHSRYPNQLNTVLVEGWLITDQAADPQCERLEILAFDFIVHRKHIEFDPPSSAAHKLMSAPWGWARNLGSKLWRQ